MLYPGARYHNQEHRIPVGVTEIKISFYQDEQEKKTLSWLVRANDLTNDKKSKILIHFHGNADTIFTSYQNVLPIVEKGYSVLLVEYPGYIAGDKGSSGYPTEESIKAVALEAFEVLINQYGYKQNEIIPVGFSLGAAPATYIAKTKNLSRLVIQSAFSSVKPFAKRYLVPSFLVRDVYDNLALLAEYDNPVLLFHGEYDTTTPFTHALSLKKVIKNLRFIPQKCNHGDCPPDWEDFWGTVDEFLR